MNENIIWTGPGNGFIIEDDNNYNDDDSRSSSQSNHSSDDNNEDGELNLSSDAHLQINLGVFNRILATFPINNIRELISGETGYVDSINLRYVMNKPTASKLHSKYMHPNLYRNINKIHTQEEFASILGLQITDEINDRVKAMVENLQIHRDIHCFSNLSQDTNELDIEHNFKNVIKSIIVTLKSIL